MIVKSSFRKAGGLHAHLMRNDSNEAVHVCLDLFRGIAGSLAEALHDMEALARLNPNVRRSFVHIVLAPAHELTTAELELALTVIETEHGIHAAAKRAVVRHEKGDRPGHYHCIYPIVNPVTGRALRSQGNYERDELISRVLEMRFGERLTPGPRLVANIAELRARHRYAEADLLAAHGSLRHTDPLDRDQRQQATRLGLDPVAWSTCVWQAFEGTGRDLARFGAHVEAQGLRVARGTKAVLIVDEATGHHDVLVRLLRREAKKTGRPLDLTEAEVGRAFPDVQPLTAVRDAGLAAAKLRAAAACETEWSRTFQDAWMACDAAALGAFRARRKAERDAEIEQDRRAFKATLEARRREILDLYARRDAVRRLRVDRAFEAARLFRSPRLRRMAFALAASGILLTGGGLVMALAGAGLLVHLLPGRARARRIQVAAQAERHRDRTMRSADLGRAYADVRRASPQRASAPRFGFEQIDKRDRILAGLVTEAILSGQIAAEPPGPVRQAVQALGPASIEGLTRMIERGSALQVRRLLHWHRGVAPAHRQAAVAAALARHAGAGPGGEDGRASSRAPDHRTVRKQPRRKRDDGLGR